MEKWERKIHIDIPEQSSVFLLILEYRSFSLLILFSLDFSPPLSCVRMIPFSWIMAAIYPTKEHTKGKSNQTLYKEHTNVMFCSVNEDSNGI